MDVYRAYFLDAEGKIMHAPVVLEGCDSDQRAIELAKPMLDGHDIELWQGNRCITRLKHED